MIAQALFLCILLSAAASHAQEGSGTLQTKEHQLNRLKLEDRQLLVDQRYSTLQSHKRELDNARALYDQQFYSLQRYKQTLNAYQEAQLEYEKALIQMEEIRLELLNNATRVRVVEARKYKATEGKRSMVDITLENVSDTGDALLVDPGLTPEELATLLKVEDIFVSLRNGPIVGEPYEQILPALEVGQRQTLTFRLLRDEDAVVIRLQYLDIEAQHSVILKKGGRQELPDINSAQFSQTGELNQTIRFDLTLERLSDEERSFALAVVGLPPRIDYAFEDNGAKVSQVKFDQKTSKVRLGLELEIPEKLDRRYIGRTRVFYALVTEAGQYAQINTLKTRYGEAPIPEEEIERLKAAYVKLELIPKGVGRLEVLVANRYQELEAGQNLDLRVEFLNRGSVAVQNVKAALDLPYEWESETDPALVKSIQPGQRAAIAIRALPPYDIAIGDYELGIEARGQVGNANIESPEKNLTIHIGARSNIAGNTILIGILVLLVLGIGLVSIRISRR